MLSPGHRCRLTRTNPGNITYNEEHHEAKTHFSKLLDQAAAGEEIIIAKAGRPVAKLVAYVEPKKERTSGALKGQIWIADDFDEFPPEIVSSFNGESD